MRTWIIGTILVAAIIVGALLVYELQKVKAEQENTEQFNTNVLNCMFEKKVRLYATNLTSKAYEEQESVFAPVSLSELAIDCSINELSQKRCASFNVNGVSWHIENTVISGIIKPEVLWRLAKCQNTNVSQT